MSQITLKAEDNKIRLTASFGLAELRFNHSQNTTQMLKFADEALYETKARGKNQVVTAKPHII